jgi:flagellar motility protein MotE (MotC chaperone)
MKNLVKWRKRPPVLHILASLLIGSAVLRIVAGGTTALAETTALDAEVVMESADAAPSLTQDMPGDIPALLAAFREREQRLAEREAQLADRLQALSVTETEVNTQISALAAAEERLRATLALADGASQTDLTQLTTVYENMKPKDAAALFEQMAPEFAAGFLGMMEPVAAAQIMAGLTPETAYSISVIVAGRNSSVPTE